MICAVAGTGMPREQVADEEAVLLTLNRADGW